MNDIDYENAIGLRNFIFHAIENFDEQDENMKSKLQSLELQLIYYIPELFKTHKSLNLLVNLKKAMTKINLQTETGAYRERFGNDEGSLKFLKNYKKFMEIMEYRGTEQSINPRSKTASQEQVSTLQAKIQTYENRILGIENQLQRAGLATPKEIEKSIDLLILSHQELIRAQEELSDIKLTLGSFDVSVLSPRAQATRDVVRKIYQRKNELEKQLVQLQNKQQQEKDDLIRESRERESQAIAIEIQKVEEQARLDLKTASEAYEARIQQLENSISADQQNLSRMKQLEELVTKAAMQANLRSPLTSIEYFQALQRQYELKNNLANSQRKQILEQIDELNIKKNELESKEKELAESRNIRGQQSRQIVRLKKELEDSKNKLIEKTKELEDQKLKTTSEETMVSLDQEIKKNKELQAQVETLKKQVDSAFEQSLKQTELFNRQYDQLKIYEQRYRRFENMSEDNLLLAAEYFEDKEELENEIIKIRNKADADIQELKGQIQLGNQDNENLRAQIETIRNKSQEDIAELKRIIDNDALTIDGLEQDNALLNQQLEKNNKEITAAYNKIRELQDKLRLEQNRVFVNRDRIQELTRQIAEARANLAASQNQLETKDDTIQNLTTQLDQLEQANQELRDQIAGVAPPAAGAAVVAPAPNIFPGDNMATQRRGLDTTTLSPIDEFLNDLEIAINVFSSKNAKINWTVEPLSKWRPAPNSITNWESAQNWLKTRGMVDLGDITENPKGLTLYMQKQNTVGGNVRTGMKDQLYANKILPLRFQPLTSEYKQGPVVKTIANLPGRERTVTSDLGTIVIPGQSNYALRRQGLNYVVTSAGKSQSFASQRDANYFIQTGGFGRKTYGPITERVFGTPTKNISQAIY